MKLTLVLTILLLACAYGYNTLEHNNGYEILNELEAGNHNVYLIMFYANATEGSPLAERNNDYEEALKERVLDNYPNFYYTKVDARNKDYEELINKSGISINDLQKGPSIFIMVHGNGAWIHGPETIAKIIEYAPAYNRRSEKA